jgi:hypothetical protein
MALVIGGAWVVAVPGWCLCALVACAGPVAWVLGGVLGGDLWPRC